MDHRWVAGKIGVWSSVMGSLETQRHSRESPPVIDQVEAPGLAPTWSARSGKERPECANATKNSFDAPSRKRSGRTKSSFVPRQILHRALSAHPRQPPGATAAIPDRGDLQTPGTAPPANATAALSLGTRRGGDGGDEATEVEGGPHITAQA